MGDKGYYSQYYDVQEPFWPMAVHSLGYNRIPPRSKNPMLKHPWHHWIDEKDGRVLPTLTIVHVINGSGTFRSQMSGELAITPRSLVFAFPNVRHFYACSKETGWYDEWLEVSADLVVPILARVGITPQNPVVEVGEHSGLVREFRRLFDLAQLKAGEGRLAACAYEILVSILEGMGQEEARSPRRAVDRLKVRLGEGTEGVSTIAQATSETGFSASWIRTVFQRETGLSPKRYQLKQRLQRAADLLLSTRRSVSEVAFQVGFGSLAAFSHSFSKEFGASPSEYRLRR